MKEFQRDATIYARDAVSQFDIMIRLSSIARCVWARDSKFYQILKRHSTLTREHLHSENGCPDLLYPQVFEEGMRAANSTEQGQIWNWIPGTSQLRNPR